MAYRDRARKALQIRLKPLQRLQPKIRPPREGWIATIRQALGMTTGQLAERLDVTQPSVFELERSEAKGSIKLETLERVAEALNCTLVYALVPKTDLDRIVHDRALHVAAQRMERVEHTMALEDQSTSRKASRRDMKELAKEIVEKEPTAIWKSK